MDKIKKLFIPENARVIVISDIHGELELFKQLLDKVDFDSGDYLIINGDLCEKGSNSDGVVRFVMELEAQYPNVHVTEGNCDTLVEDLVEENPELLRYLQTRQHSILNEWLDKIGFVIGEDTSVGEIKERLTCHFSKEINWLLQLPTAIEADDYIFVHAGLEDRVDWKETERLKAITFRSFLHHTHNAGEHVIVGHWPVVNYSSDISSHKPIIDEGKKMIAIDGGNIIKKTGQLNALIIDRLNKKDSIAYTYTDSFPQFEVLEDFHADAQLTGAISYPSYELVPIKAGQHFTLCEQVETINKLYVKNEYFYQGEDGSTYAKNDVSCAQISVEKGDIVSLIDDNCSGYDLIKKNGVIGWIGKGILASHDSSHKKSNSLLNK
ncbi:metallophosphoesterase [Rossellomorea aquimaris]|uniref:Serine/threonine protein phosphatase n=1 Tax=Rossellomorea aquimaris TaxID=189382 RepID=A0A1J6W2L3_9BACI|nr:metallophosphoesterase [Rossellomorea aquimaris]OIU71834.1 serine/threonine protein phosphatase [Rossellomorea aquimaris]